MEKWLKEIQDTLDKGMKEVAELAQDGTLRIVKARIEAQKKWLLKNRWDTPAERERTHIKIEAYNTVLSELREIPRFKLAVGKKKA